MAERGKASGCWLGRLQNGSSARMRSLMPAPPTHTPSSKTALRMLCQISQILRVRRWKSMTDTPQTAGSRPSPHWEQCTALDLAHRSCSVGSIQGRDPMTHALHTPSGWPCVKSFNILLSPAWPVHRGIPWVNSFPTGTGEKATMVFWRWAPQRAIAGRAAVGAPQCEGGHCQETPTKVAAVPVTHRNLWHQAAASGTVLVWGVPCRMLVSSTRACHTWQWVEIIGWWESNIFFLVREVQSSLTPPPNLKFDKTTHTQNKLKRETITSFLKVLTLPKGKRSPITVRHIQAFCEKEWKKRVRRR